jgi:hypothetical protein
MGFGLLGNLQMMKMCVCSAFLAPDHRRFLHLRLRFRFQAGPGERTSQEVEQHVCHCLKGARFLSDEKSELQPRKKWEAMTLDILDNDCQQVNFRLTNKIQ